MPNLTDALQETLSRSRRALTSQFEHAEWDTEAPEEEPDRIKADGGTATSGAAEAGDVPADAPELVYGPDRVADILNDAEGRLWQSDIVDRMDVSESTVSRWLCTLEDADRIERLRIGRENLVMLPGDHPELAESSLPSRPKEGQ